MIQGLVSIIVVNWNGKDVIGPCLKSLTAQTYESREIIVVDNGSTDASLKIIREEYGSSVVIAENFKTLGFAEGATVGIRLSRGEFVALLNSDARAKEDWIEKLVDGIRRSESIGMCASKIYLAGEEKVLDNTGLVLSRD